MKTANATQLPHGLSLFIRAALYILIYCLCFGLKTNSWADISLSDLSLLAHIASSLYFALYMALFLGWVSLLPAFIISRYAHNRLIRTIILLCGVLLCLSPAPQASLPYAHWLAFLVAALCCAALSKGHEAARISTQS